MDLFLNFNHEHLTYIEPLSKWRILDIQSLLSEAPRSPNYKSFTRILRKLEAAQLVKAWLDPISKKKFLYLTSFGERVVSDCENPSSLQDEYLAHDIKAASFVKGLLDAGWVERGELEHNLTNKANFHTTHKLIPDAVVHFSKKGFEYKMAIEIELTRKSNIRITEKIKQYFAEEHYHLVGYVFPTISLMEKYKGVLLERFGLEVFKKIIFLHHAPLVTTGQSLAEITGFYQGKEVFLRDLLSKNLSVNDVRTI